MFVRRKINRSGSISISVVDKSRGRYEVVRSFGTARTAEAADLLENRAREFVRDRTGDSETLFDNMTEAQLRDYAATLDQGRIELAGPELLFGPVFDRLGLGAGRDSLFRHLVLCRLCYPGSVLRAAEYVRRYLGQQIGPAEIFRLIDGLHLTELHVPELSSACCDVFPSPLPRHSFCLFTDEDGRPLAARLLERSAAMGEKGEKSLQRLARKYGAAAPVRIRRGAAVPRQLPSAFRMGKKDMAFKPMLRRRRGRVEGCLCICLAAYAVRREMEQMIRDRKARFSFDQVCEAARTMYRLNYISPYTRRPKSVLVQPTPIQKQLLESVY
ncbi:MAG: hypothetical protein IJL93_07060 [Bacteroidales bacterium]|nr:hypothetical protein [Bacteroidales bacterium]